MKQSNGNHGDSVGVGSDSSSLPVLLDILYPKHLSQKLSGISTLYPVPLCAILYKSFSLSLHISEEPKRRG